MIESKKVTETSEKLSVVVKQMLEPFNITGGLPEGFWRDPYALGFLQGTLVTLAKIASRGELEGKKVAQVALNVFKATVPGRGAEIYNNAVTYYSQANPSYLDAMSAGMMSIAVIYGSDDFNENPDVKKARAMAEEALAETGREGDTPSSAEVGSMLQYMLFQTAVSERLGRKYPQ